MNRSPIYDMNGREIHEGDLLRTLHFIGARRKKHYLYHVATLRNGVMYGIPARHANPSLACEDGVYNLDSAYADTFASEIIAGYGPGDILDYADRPRRKL